MQFQDIHISDTQLYNLFRQYFSVGNYTQALNILSQNSQLTNKIVNAEIINDLSERLSGFENEYYTEVEQYLSQLLADMQTEVDNLSNQNEYSATVQYRVKNFVYYNNEIYFCTLTPPVGTLPTNTQYWLYLGLKGKTGQNSLINMTFKGLYSDTTEYNTYDIVYQGNTFYYAIQGSTGQSLTDTTYWGVLFNASIQQVLASSTQPDIINPKDFWWQEI